ncbi:hypothetical protein JYT53_00915 [Cytophagaceae bacterium AH-315-L13]|nr:hypothetical protein [Cytophagaceae bacterium AH-315-L13]
MKTNLNDFINSLSQIDVLYLHNHVANSKERLQVLNAIKKHLNGENFKDTFKYQEYDIHRKHISRFKFYAEKVFEDNSWSSIQEKLNFYAKRLINKAVAKRNTKIGLEILELLENDKKYCEKFNHFCLHNATIVKFILKNISLQLQHINDYDNQKRALDLLEFYYPYFEEQEKCFLYSSKLKYEFRDRKWERLDDEIENLKNYYQNTHQDILTKISLYSYFIPYSLINKQKKEHQKMMEELLHVISNNPYHNTRLNALANKLFFNDSIYLNDIESAMRYYTDMKKTEVDLSDTSNYIFHLEIALNLYDIEQVKKFMPKHNPLSMLQIDRFVVPYIVKFYLLTNKIEFAKFYMEYALRRMKKYDSIVYFIHTYSAYFTLLYRERDYKKIIDTYESLSFRKKHIQSQKGGEMNFDIRFFYILANFQLDQFNHESCCNKLCQLINPKSEDANLFIKLKMKKNLDYLYSSNFELDNRLIKRYDLLKEQVHQLEEFFN